ncbi:hypothetical protein DH2020_003956 [Rehmannia glutinosa]|uniref:Endonuclease/exonuclease/phosphatase domain-containing protein n=1 Tax=Rehmannia glutinosa TaxID=99300 RepID=A0ABR0XN45_REHGL
MEIIGTNNKAPKLQLLDSPHCIHEIPQSDIADATTAENYRGLGNPRTIRELREVIRDKSPHLLFLCETKCNSHAIDKLKSDLGFYGLSVDSTGRSSGLALLWCKNIQVTLRIFSSWFIDVDVNFLDPIFRVTDVYGEPNVSLRHTFWNQFPNTSSPQDHPWLCFGDFNEVLSVRVPRLRHPIRMANSSIPKYLIGLFLIRHGVPRPPIYLEQTLYSPFHTRVRLDRALCTEPLLNLFPFKIVNHVPILSSDHHALYIQLRNQPNQPTRHRRYKHFLFKACWIQKKECENIIKENWNSDLDTL